MQVRLVDDDCLTQKNRQNCHEMATTFSCVVISQLNFPHRVATNSFLIKWKGFIV